MNKNHSNIASLCILSSVSNISYSAGGDCAFIRTVPAKDGNSYQHFLYLLFGNEPTCLFEMKYGLLYLWLNRSEILFQGAPFPSAPQSSGTFFYLYDTLTRTAEEAFFLPSGIRKIISENGKYYFTVQTDCSDCDDNYEADYQIVDELPFYYNGAGFVNKKRNTLFIYDPRSQMTRRISGRYENVSDFAVIGNSVYFAAKEYRSKMPLREHLFRYEEKSGMRTPVIPEREFFFSGMCEWNGSLAFFASEGQNCHYWESPSLYVTDGESERCRLLLSPDRHPSNKLHLDTAFFGGTILASRAGYLYFLMTDGSACSLFSFSPKTGLTQLTNNPGGVLCFSLSPVSDEISVSALWHGAPDELYLLGPEESQLTDFNRAYRNSHNLYRPEKISFSFGGHETDAWVVKPASCDAGGSCPAVLYIHGGPLLAFSEAFLHEIQVLSDAGFFVFYCNPAGSDGRGDAFSDIRGKFGRDDYEELMAFTDAVLERFPRIDRERVCVTGGSYAGFMTNWIIGHTHRFCCAVSQRSISNWISFYGDTDIGSIYAPVYLDADPFRNADLFWDRSPMKYVSDVTTPTLFLHADEDGCAPLSEAMQMYTALCDREIETRLIIFKKENHDLSRNGLPRHKQKRLEEMTDWFCRYASPSE